MWWTLLTLALYRKTIPFPRRVLAKFLADEAKAVPGTRIDSPTFRACGHDWQVSLYPFGGNADPYFAGRVGVYLKLLQPADSGKVEVDASFSLTLRTLPTAAAGQTEHDKSTQRGICFRCGMTFCDAAEAGSSVGRCEDWGAHVYPSDLLLRELEVIEGIEAMVDVELEAWDSRPSRWGASMLALYDQVQRLPLRRLRAGEVVVALSSSDSTGGGFRSIDGSEYRVMRLVSADGSACFDSTRAATAFLLPTNSKAREGGTFATNEASMMRVFYEVVGDQMTARDAAAILRESSDGLFVGIEPSHDAAAGSIEWPIAVTISRLPPLASRLGLRALPTRLRYALRTRARGLLLFLLIGASPLLVGFIASQFVSAFAIPSRSMEATLQVGDVVLAEKLSSRLGLPFQVNDLVLFSPPPELQSLVASAGGKLGSRDLFIKRVAAVAGETVSLDPFTGDVLINGVRRPMPPLACADPAQTNALSTAPSGSASGGGGGSGGGGSGGSGSSGSTRIDVTGEVLQSRLVPPHSIFVLGDCPARSTDSRVWGPLPVENVVARPVVRIWPVGRQGAIVDTEDLNPFRRALEQAQPSRTARTPGLETKMDQEGFRVHREPAGARARR